jgi:FAD:protein FMN transferase
MATQARHWRQIGTNVDVVVSNGALDAACAAVEARIDAADRTFSRFRSDSELSQLNRTPDTNVHVSELLALAIGTALEAAAMTDGLVDPSVGRAVRMAGYDRDFEQLQRRSEFAPTWNFETVAGWQAVKFDPLARTVRIPRGVELDLDSTGKALIVDLAAGAAAAVLPADAGVLVSIGGDMRVAGRPPRGGWRVLLSEDSATSPSSDGPVASIRSGALATSSTTVRRWRRNGQIVHHLIDPRTGRPSDGPWRTATVVAGTCVDANSAATCAIVLGRDAQAWLEQRGIPARLVAQDGQPTFVAGWPADESHAIPAAA